MSIKYICILAFISILETQIESKVDIQNEKNILSLRSSDNLKKINSKLSRDHQTAPYVYKIHKKYPKYTQSKSPKNYYQSLLELLPFFQDTSVERQQKQPSKVHKIYSDYPRDDKRRQKKLSSSRPNIKPPRAGIKNSKVSKKIPIRNKYPKEKKVHEKFEKGSSKKQKNLSNPEKNISKRINTPSIYLKPPEIGEKNFFNTHKRGISVKSFKKPSKRVPDRSKEENSQEKERYYVRDHEPIHQKPDKANESNNDNNSQEELSQEVDNSGDDENRVDFHIHGHDGPESYVFGFDTGDGDNRQFRWEQRHINGTVTGQYGYYDPRGKFKKIFYRSDPFLGYQQSTLNEEYHAKNLIENEGN